MKPHLPLALASFLALACSQAALATTITKEVLHITFQDNAPVVDNGLTGTVETLKSTSATSTDYTTVCDYKTGTGSAVSSGTLFAPNVNPANSGQWQATLTLTGLAEDSSLNFSAIQLDTMGFNVNGNYQESGNSAAPTGTTATGSTAVGKYVGFTIECSTDGTSWTQVGPTYSIDMVVKNQQATQTLFSMDEVATLTGETIYLRVSTSRDYTAGTFAGLTGITLMEDLELADVSWAGGDGAWTTGSFGSTTVEGDAASIYFTFGAESFSAEVDTITATLESVLAPGGVFVDAGEGHTYILAGEGGFSGDGSLTVNSGTLKIQTSDNSAWLGNLAVNDGARLELGADATAGSNIITVNAGARLELVSGDWALDSRIDSSSLGTIALIGTTTASVGNSSADFELGEETSLTLTGTSYAGSFRGNGTLIVANSVTVGSFGEDFTGVWQVESGKTLTANIAASQTAQMALAGAGSFTKMGAGTVNIQGAPQKSAIGGMYVAAGVVNVLQDVEVTDLVSLSQTGTLILGNGTDAVTMTTTRFRGADSNIAGNHVMTIKENAALIVTGEANADGDARGASILLGHWVGSLAMSIKGLMTAEKAKIYMTHSTNATATQLVVAGTGVLNALGITKDTHGSSTAAGTLILEDGAHVNLGSAGLTRLGSVQAGAAIIGSFADTWSSDQNVSLTSADGLKFHTGKYDIANAIYSDTEGTSVTMSGVISDATGVAGSVVKTGVGVLTLQGANTYSGETLVEQGTLALSGSGSLGTGGVTVKNAEDTVLTMEKMSVKAYGGDATVRGLSSAVTASSTSWAGASTAEPATVSLAEVTLSSEGDQFTFTNVEWLQSRVNIQQAESVAMNHVVIGPGTKLENANGATLTIVDSSLMLSSESLSGAIVPPGDNAPVALSYNMAGASVSGTLTLDLSGELLRAIAATSSAAIFNVQLSLENVSEWSVQDQDLSWGNELAIFSPEAIRTEQVGDTIIMNMTFGNQIPEPASSALALLGVGGLLLRRRRRA